MDLLRFLTTYKCYDCNLMMATKEDHNKFDPEKDNLRCTKCGKLMVVESEIVRKSVKPSEEHLKVIKEANEKPMYETYLYISLHDFEKTRRIR